MGLHIYCIVPAGREPPSDLAGLEGAAVTAIDAGSLAIWTTAHELQPAASLETIRTHNEVVQAAMTESVTPVPVRYGQWLPGGDEARARVLEEEARWVQLLERFAGRAEYGVRVEVSAGEQDVQESLAESGTEYMAALATKMARAAARRSEGDRIVDELERRTAGVVIDRRITHFPSGRQLVGIAHLVAWTDAAAYHSAVANAKKVAGDVVLRVSGPWPPWSFVE